MRLRTQLVLASFLLAIVPLTAIVLYSYESSRVALEKAYRHEAARLTRQMDTRLAAIRGDLETRLAGVSTLPLQNLPDATNSANPHPVVDEVVMAMSDVAPLVDAVEFQPQEAPQPSQPAQPAQQEPKKPVAQTAEAPPPPPPARTPRVVTIAPVVVSPAEIGMAPGMPMATTEPIVIDMPDVPMPRFQMPPDFKQRITEIGTLSKELSQNSATMTAEQREAMSAQIRAKSEAIQAEVAANRARFEKDLQAALEARERKRQAHELARQQRSEERAREREASKSVTKESSKSGTHEEVKETVAVASPPAVVVDAAAHPSLLAPAPTPVPEKKVATHKPAPRMIHIKRPMTPQEMELMRQRERQVSSLFGHDFGFPVEREGKIVGRVAAQISPDEVIRRVLGTGADEGGIPFAIDRDGHFYTLNDSQRAKLTEIGVPGRLAGIPDWIVVMRNAGTNGLRVGVARRVGEDLEELRRTAGRNFGYGLMLVFIALIGIVPMANHMTRDVSAIAQGAERVALGDLQTRVPVRSKNEFGQLAVAFNRMAHDLSEHQQRLLHQRVLAVEYERKASELEEARRFQLSMLPKEVPRLDHFEVAVFTQTATEVGGDYYDFHVSRSGALTVAIGDATGHGAKAGTMVTVIKTLFAGYDDAVAPGPFLSAAAEKIKRMDLGRMAMALSICRIEVNQLTIASAGMPPVLIHHAATNAVDEIALEATPLGTLGTDYQQHTAPVAKGDTILFMSDGLPELTNELGHQLGYTGATDAFATAAGETTARMVIERMVDAARAWHGDQPPNDDITFVAVRVT